MALPPVLGVTWDEVTKTAVIHMVTTPFRVHRWLALSPSPQCASRGSSLRAYILEVGSLNVKNLLMRLWARLAFSDRDIHMRLPQLFDGYGETNFKG